MKENGTKIQKQTNESDENLLKITEAEEDEIDHALSAYFILFYLL
jgi:hypothetical protein